MAAMTENTIYFWRPHEEYGYLGNWFTSYFTVGGKTFCNSEQYFMWKKQQLFDPDNKVLENKILTSVSPKSIKGYGRKVQNFDEEVWGENKYEFMKEAVMHKFSQNEDLLHQLLSTDGSNLVEASPYDRIWGIGINRSDAEKGKKWKG